jgi:multidrug resistance efflux pump
MEKKINETVYASGNIESANQYQVVSLVSGYIDEVLVNEGEKIAENSTIIKLANEGGLIALKSAELNKNFADLKQNNNKIKELKFAVNTAKIKWKNDSIQLKRKKYLAENNVISENELENFEVIALNSKSNYLSMTLQLDDLIKQLKLNDEIGKRNYDQSSKNVKDFNIKSKINGVVYSILKKTGDLVTPQTPLAIIGEYNKYIIKLQVDEYDITRINIGQKVKIKLDSYKGLVFDAKITKIYPFMNEKSKTFTLEAIFVNSPNKLYPNLTVEANIIIKTKSKALLIPREYLFNDKIVFLKNGSKKTVSTGIKDLQYVEILSGLSKNDEIIIPNEN